jgi:hypothetical protein
VGKTLYFSITTFFVTLIIYRKRRRKEGRPPLGNDLDQPYSLSNMSASQVSVISDIFSDIGPLDTPAPISLAPKQSLPVIVKISSIEASRLKRVKWNGKNDPYVVLSLGNYWRYETEVVWSAPDPVTWTVDLVTSSNPRNKKSRQDEDQLLIQVYSANLVRDDQLVGSGAIPLSHLIPNAPRSVTLDLVHESSDAKSGVTESGGVISLLLTLEETTELSNFAMNAINQRNQHNREKSDPQNRQRYEVKSQPKDTKETKILSPENENASKSSGELKPIPAVAEEKPKRSVRISETKPKLTVAEAKSKKRSEDSKETLSDTTQPVQSSRPISASNHRSEPIPKPSKLTGGSKSDQSTVDSGAVSTKVPSKHLTREKSESKRTIRPSLKEEDGKRETGEREGRGERDEGGEVTTDDEAKKMKSISPEHERESEKRKNKKMMKKVLPAVSSSLVDRFVAFDLNDLDISPDSHKRVVDEALEIAIHEESSSITLLTHEVALVLDALNFPLNEGALNPPSAPPPAAAGTLEIETSALNSSRSYSSYSSSTSSKSSVLLSLQNPALMAAALTEFSRDKQLVNLSLLPSASHGRQVTHTNNFSITEYQSITAIRQLLGLIYGNKEWKKVRKLILTASDTAVSFGGGRPSYWTSQWIDKMVSLLHLPSNKFLDYNGEDFLSLLGYSQGQGQGQGQGGPLAMMKSSILKARCRLYVKILSLLDTWWDQDIFPKDTLVLLDKGTSSATNCSNGAGATSRPKVGVRTSVPTVSSKDKEENQIKLKKKKQLERTKEKKVFQEGDCVRIALPGPLLAAYLPIQRAYAWQQTTPEDLTALTETIGGMIGFVSTHSPYGTSRIEIPGMTWVGFQEEHLHSASGTGTGTGIGLVREQIIQLLRELEGKIEPISGRSVLVPTVCLEESSLSEEILLEPSGPKASQGQGQGQQKPRQQLLSSLPFEELVVGMPVRVESFEVMCKAYEKYDWWDRPSLSLLQSFSGKLGVVISVANVIETGRVGVSIQTQQQGKQQQQGQGQGHRAHATELVDALPLEALIRVPPPDPATAAAALGSEAVDGEIKKGSRSNGKAMKPMKKKPMASQSTQVINENIVTSAPKTMKPKLQSEEPPLFQKRQQQQQPSLPSQRVTSRPSRTPAATAAAVAAYGDDEEEIEEDYLLEEVTGGDESAPPDNAANDKNDFDLREVMVKDLRIAESREAPSNPKPVSSVSFHQTQPTGRPLYRPLTTFNLLNPPSPSLNSDHEDEVTSPVPKYEWMKRSLAPTTHQPQHQQGQHGHGQQQKRQQRETQTKEGRDANEPTIAPLSRPKFSTFEFDPKLLGPQPGDRNGNANGSHSNHRPRTSGGSSSASASRSQSHGQGYGHRRQQEDHVVTDKMNFSSAEDNFFIDGIRFRGGGGGGNDSNTQQRPQSAASGAAGAPFRKNSSSASVPRPSSAGSTRRSGGGRGLSSSVKGSVKKQTSDFLRGEEQRQELEEERVKRDLRRSEREMKIKEAALKRQAKKYGVDLDVYDSYHDV